MSIYLTSDDHFGHENIIRFCNRPFENIHIMNKTLTENWNSLVGEDDEIYNLGDLAWNKATSYIKYLNGNMTWIRGNHDRNSNMKGAAQMGVKLVQRMDLEYKGYFTETSHSLCGQMSNLSR